MSEQLLETQEEKQKIRDAHKQIAKDFGYSYDKKSDMSFIRINDDLTDIPVEQAYTFPLSDEEFNTLKNYEAELKQKNIPNILKNPNLFELINQQFDKKIVGEEKSRKVILLCASGRLVENSLPASFNLLVNSETGAGKDYIVRSILDILPNEQHINKTRISPATFSYWHNSKYEPDWTWNGKVFYCEDIPQIVLNSEVFKVMCSEGSSATIVIKNRAVDIEISGKPVIITTTSYNYLSKEMIRRFVNLMLNESKDQTKAIMKRHSEFKKKGIVPEYDKELKEALKYLQRVKVKIPYADKIDEHFPSSIIMRTNYPRFLDFICASASLHQFQREKLDEYILANAQDYEIARECFLTIFSNKEMIPLTRLQKQILEALKTGISGLATHILKECRTSLPSLITNLEILASFDFVEIYEIFDYYGKSQTGYKISDNYTSLENLSIPEFDELDIDELDIKEDKVNKDNKEDKDV